jgi:hypothetical protein
MRQLFEKFATYIPRCVQNRPYQNAVRGLEDEMRLEPKAPQTRQNLSNFSPHFRKIRQQAERPLQTLMVRLGLIPPKLL